MKTLLLAFAILTPCLVFSQDSSRINLPVQYSKGQLESEANHYCPLYDTMEVFATIQDRDGIIKTEPCTLRLKAKKVIVLEDVGQFENITGIKRAGRFVLIPDWRINKLIRKRNSKSLYKGRIIKIIQTK
jgi:hypothetical protein